VALKIELKPNERVMLGDCVVTNSDQRTRITIDGSLPILRETDIMSLSQANSPAKRIYLAVQFIYLSKHPKDNHALYFQLARAMLMMFPATKPLIDRINNQILTGHLYKALKEARKLITYEKEHPEMHSAAKAYAKTAKETASPRELEASLLLKAAAKLQAARESWTDKKPRTVFIDAVVRDDNKLPKQVCQNLTALGMRVMSDTFALMTKPQPEHLSTLIDINRGIAAGLRGKN
jgi:flagellar protein FlbT